MKSFALLTIGLFCLSNLQAQYKNDNVTFKTVYPDDLQKELNKHPERIILDVRSDGEYYDTSSMRTMNIGRLKDAKHIDVGDLGKKLNELQGFKNTPVFVYCSHSQRSRRASKMLADSGFTQVYNINGGMTTLLQTSPGIHDIYETKNNYVFISPAELCMSKSSQTFLLDVRPDSAFRSITTNDRRNALGIIKHSTNIPVADLQASIAKIPKDKKIILIDDNGDASAQAANILKQNGFSNIAILFNGLENFVATYSPIITCRNEIWQTKSKYTVITGEDFDAMAKIDKDLTIVDVRTEAEFTNKAKDNWRNIGHINKAINIPSSDIKTRSNELSAYKQKPIVLYSFGSGGEVFTSATQLAAAGYEKVYVLSGGLFNLRWKAANIKGRTSLKEWVVDIPVENL